MRLSQTQTEQLLIDNLSKQQILCIAIESANLLGWIFGDINKTGFIAYTNNGLFSWNAEIRVKIKNGIADLQSKSIGDDLINLRENKKNIEGFISTFESLKKTLTIEELETIYENLKGNFI